MTPERPRPVPASVRAAIAARLGPLCPECGRGRLVQFVSGRGPFRKCSNCGWTCGEQKAREIGGGK